MQELDGRNALTGQGRSTAWVPMNPIFRDVLVVEHDISSPKHDTDYPELRHDGSSVGVWMWRVAL